MTRRALTIIVLLLATTGLLLHGPATAVNAGEEAPHPEGLWRTIDDESGREKAIVKVWVEEGELQAKIIELLWTDTGDLNPKCTACEGERKDQPIVGMTIVWGMKHDGEHWTDGTILDPKSGSEYRCNIGVSPDGKTLDVRGYLGLSLFGRTQVWHRQSRADTPTS